MCSFDFYYSSFKLVSSSSKTPKQVFFNVINIWTLFTHTVYSIKNTLFIHFIVKIIVLKVFSGYRVDLFWWESLILLRKYLIVGLTTFFVGQDTVQLMGTFAIIIASLHLHDVHKPYGAYDKGTAFLHTYDTISLLNLIFVVWCGK